MKQLIESLFVCVVELTVLSVVDPCRDFGNTSMKNGKDYYQFSKFALNAQDTLAILKLD